MARIAQTTERIRVRNAMRGILWMLGPHSATVSLTIWFVLGDLLIEGVVDFIFFVIRIGVWQR